MKSFLTIFCIALCITISSYAQTNFSLSETMYFYSSDSNLSVEKVKETSVIQPDKSINVYKYFDVTGAESYNYLSFFEENNNSGINTYILESKVEPKFTAREFEKAYDTLYFVLDQDYNDKLVLIDQEINDGGLPYPYWINSNLGYRIIEHGIVNIFAKLVATTGHHLVFKENLNFDGTDTVFLSASEATHQVSFEPVNEDGVLFSDLPQPWKHVNKYSLVFDLSNGGIALVSMELSSSRKVYVSDYSGEIHMCFGSLYKDPDLESSNYYIEFPILDNINQPITLANDPEKLSSTILNYTYFEECDNSKIGLGYYNRFISGISGEPTIWGGAFFYDYPDTEYWQTTLFMDMVDSDKLNYVTRNIIRCGNNEIIQSPYFDELDDSIAGIYEYVYYADAHKINDYDTLSFGFGTSYYWPVWSNLEASIDCYSDNMGIFGNYYGADYSTDKFLIRDVDGNLVSEGTGLEIQFYSMEPGKYTVEQINKNCHFESYVGSSSLLSSFNTTLVDKNPPPIRHVQLLNNENTIKYHFGFGEQILLKFSASDFDSYDYVHVGTNFKSIIDSLTKVSIVLHQGTDWTEVNTNIVYSDSLIGSLFSSSLTGYLSDEPAMYDIKIYVEDYSGNSSEQTFSPAFVYGNYIVGNSEHSNNEIIEEAIIIHPNPAYHSIKITAIDGELNEVNSFEILSMNGDVLRKGIINQTTNSIDISDLASGIYIISLFDDDIPIMSKKLIKLD